MKKFGYWCIAYAMILLSIAFLWEVLIIGKNNAVQSSVMAKGYNEVSLITGGAVETGVDNGKVEVENKESTVTKQENSIKKGKKSSKNIKKSKSKKKKTKKSKSKKNKSKKSHSKKAKSTSKKRKILKKIEEKKVLERIVEAEAGGQDEKGRILVANVILNRVEKKKFPNSVRGVVFAYDQGCYQFSPIMDGRYYSVKVSKGTKRAVSKALSGVDYSKGALYFMCRRSASSKNARWFDSRLKKVLKHGAHEFFK